MQTRLEAFVRLVCVLAAYLGQVGHGRGMLDRAVQQGWRAAFRPGPVAKELPRLLPDEISHDACLDLVNKTVDS